ncbi:MAG: AmmeMemoRadiSam system protein A [Eubacteriales bacterium]
MPIVGAFIVPHPPIILPEVGRGKEKEIQKTINAYKEVSRQIAELKPDTIVLTSPHATMYADYFHISSGKSVYGDLGRFGVPGVNVLANYDIEFVEALTDAVAEENVSAGTLGERDKTLDHGTIIPLRFLNEQYSDYKLIRIGLSGLSMLEHYRLGKCIAKTSERLSKRVVFIASGDLSHKLKEDGPYGFDKTGPEFDSEITTAMANADFLHMMEFDADFCESAAECGLRSFIIMAGALDGRAIKAELLSYEGNFGVGYAVCSFKIEDKDENRHFDLIYEKGMKEKLNYSKSKEDEFVRLARLSLETYIKTKKRINLPEGLPKEMLNNKAGTFVSLKKNGQLRGCIGTISPVTDCVATEILRNAISSGTEDPRFPAVTESELNELIYSVDVLAAAESIKSVVDLDVKRYGVIVTNGYKRGLLLPNLEGVDSPEKQISIALQKAGIKQDDDYSMERFEVVRHK